MDSQLWIICGLTFVIHVIATLAYAVRIGVRATHRVVVLVVRDHRARVANGQFSGPFTRNALKWISRTGWGAGCWPISVVLLSATVATIVGSFLPRSSVISVARRTLPGERSIPRLLLDAVARGSTICASAHIAVRTSQLTANTGVSWGVIALNVAAMAIWTVGVFASLYAGYLKPDLRVTCANLSSVINGFATVVLAVVIDPQVSVMTDDVIGGRISRAIATLAGARVLGTLARKQCSFRPRSSSCASPS